MRYRHCTPCENIHYYLPEYLQFYSGIYRHQTLNRDAIKFLSNYYLILLPRLGIPDLGIGEKYQRVLQNYGRDIEMVSRIYNKQKMDPPISRGLPPIAGKILWARQLYRRIQQPMELFQQHPGVLDTAEAKRIIRNYNRVAKVLLEFEVLYHQGWMAQVRFTVMTPVKVLNEML